MTWISQKLHQACKQTSLNLSTMTHAFQQCFSGKFLHFLNAIYRLNPERDSSTRKPPEFFNPVSRSISIVAKMYNYATSHSVKKYQFLRDNWFWVIEFIGRSISRIVFPWDRILVYYSEGGWAAGSRQSLCFVFLHFLNRNRF